jgi:HAE1 family hydrophobic/amphiphilic exporter-1
MWISDLSIQHILAMVIGALVALGLVSLMRIGVDLFPRVEFPRRLTPLERKPEAIETEVLTINLRSTISSSRSPRNRQRARQVMIEFGLNETRT